MAITVVRQATTIDSSSNVASPQFTGTPTAGNDIIVPCHSFDAGDAAPGTCADNASGGSNSYASNIYGENAGQVCAAQIFRAEVNNTLSNLTVTVTASTGSAVCATAIEVSDLAVTPVDITTSVVNDTTSPWTLATGTLAQADEIIVAAFCFEASGFGDWGLAVDSWSGSSPTTLYVNDGAGVNSEYGAAAYLIVSSTASKTVSFSAADNGGVSVVVLATYKAFVAETPTTGSLGDFDPLMRREAWF